MDGRDHRTILLYEPRRILNDGTRPKSTYDMINELHNQGTDEFVYTCNTCKWLVETRYHCTVCDDFDLCVPCYNKEGHPHKMDKLGLDIDVGTSPGDMKQANPQEARELSIQRCIQSLDHACQCRRDANCRLPSCQKMKRVVRHTKICKRKTEGDCPICKQLIALCCYHAKQCQETKCSVPFCSSIKQKLKQHQVQQANRMAAMNTHAAPSTSSPPPPPALSSPPPSKPQSQLPHNVQKALQQNAQNQQAAAGGVGVGSVGGVGPGVGVGGVGNVCGVGNVGLGAGVPQQQPQQQMQHMMQPQQQQRLQMHQMLPQQQQVQQQVGGVVGMGGTGTVAGMQGGGWFKQAPAGMMGMRGAYGGGGGPGARLVGAPRYPYGGGVARSPPATPSPRPPTPSELLLLRQSPAPPQPHPPPDDQLPPMTPQDQLTKFVEQL